MCLVVMKTQGYYSRDIVTPFFSDLGRDSANYYIFVTALTVAAISQAIGAWVIFKDVIKPKLREVKKWYLNALAYVSLVTAILSTPFLPAIGLYPVHSHFTVHWWSASLYFVLTAFTHLMQLILYYCLYKSVTDDCEWRQSVKKWGLRRALLCAIAFPYFVQTKVGVNSRTISYDECMARIEHTMACPGFTEASLCGVEKYPWRRKNGKALSESYEFPILWDEFERVPDGESMEEIMVTQLWSFAGCYIAGNLLTLSQAICIFAMSLVYVTFYFDFVFAKSIVLEVEDLLPFTEP